MRFDDSLETVLSAEMSTPFGAQSAWRQLVDLVGRRRVPADAQAIAELRALRLRVPPPVRAASVRALVQADPPAVLVRLLVDDDIAVAAPILRVARLRADDWIDMLPGMSPAARSILRHRRDLAPEVERALESFGAADFRLAPPDPGAALPEAIDDLPAEPPVPADDVTPPAGTLPAAETPEAEPAVTPEPVAATLPVPQAQLADDFMPDVIDWHALSDLSDDPVASTPPVAGDAIAAIVEAPVVDAETDQPEPLSIDWTDVIDPDPIADAASAATASPLPAAPEAPAAAILPPAPGFGESPFASLGSIALGLPVVAEALRRAESERVDTPPPPPSAGEGPFEIAELVARLNAYERQRDDAPGGVPLIRQDDDAQPALFDLEPAQAQSFRFETDAAGVVRWIEGAARAPLIGLSLDLSLTATPAADGRVDGVAGGAFRRRAGFTDARLVVGGTSDAAGQWRITGTPVFDRASGRFTGYRGAARRPRADESAEPMRARAPVADALRQLVHELRTPTNAIAGFAEMIETQLLGPVPQAYREQAGTIRGQAADLLVAIDDIDLAARLETHALDLRAETVPLAPLLVRVARDLQPLAAMRGTEILIDPGPLDLAIAADERAVERLVGRLMSTLVASGGAGEKIAVVATLDGDAQLSLVFDRPRALAAFGTDAILTIDAEAVAEAEGAPLLGTGFALRLARNLAVELGGALTIDARSLTLRLPAAVNGVMGQASSS